ncbi:MAG TPA: hypothetical protein VFD70_17135 [Anaerolineae bacterium]|nr:hypothetical protein [Anaerolineae bacterium]
MKNENKFTQDFAHDWDNAAQRAAENARRENEPGRDMLNAAAGLRVQSGLQAGLWSASCGDSCTCVATCTM